MFFPFFGSNLDITAILANALKYGSLGEKSSRCFSNAQNPKLS